MDYMVHELAVLQDMSKGDPAKFETQCTPNDAAQSKWSTDPSTWGEGFLSAYSPDQFALLEQFTPVRHHLGALLHPAQNHRGTHRLLQLRRQ